MKCYACDRPMRVTHHGAYTKDGQLQFVGIDCYRLIVKADRDGYQPPRGGPRLFAPNLAANAEPKVPRVEGS